MGWHVGSRTFYFQRTRGASSGHTLMAWDHHISMRHVYRGHGTNSLWDDDDDDRLHCTAMGEVNFQLRL
jgi:hypothetical protein